MTITSSNFSTGVLAMIAPRRQAAKVLLTVVLTTTACDGRGQVAAPEAEIQRGIIEFDDKPVRITAPASVVLGAPATIDVTTYGGGCVGKGETRVTVEGLLAVVEPFDRFTAPPSDGACADILLRLSHVVTIEFTKRGAATLRVRGLRVPGDELIEVQRTIIVQ